MIGILKKKKKSNGDSQTKTPLEGNHTNKRVSRFNTSKNEVY